MVDFTNSNPAPRTTTPPRTPPRTTTTSTTRGPPRLNRTIDVLIRECDDIHPMSFPDLMNFHNNRRRLSFFRRNNVPNDQ